MWEWRREESSPVEISKVMLSVAGNAINTAGDIPRKAEVQELPVKETEQVVSSPNWTRRLRNGIGDSIAVLYPLPSWQRLLLSYFSDHIAPVMQAIDDSRNGYRALILPIAESDALVLNAVLAASAYHVSQKISSMLPTARRMYTVTIRSLIQRAKPKTGNEPNLDEHSILTIFVLLISAMITGEPDFKLIFGMLKSTLQAIGDETVLGSSDLGQFLLRQIRK
ncbi:hypothetical protein ABEF95_014676 [Exophiala dermatitidis]